MEGLSIAFSIVGSVALLFGLGLACWRLTMLLRWTHRSAVVVSYRHQRVYRGSAYVKLSVRFAGENGESIAATDVGPWNRYSEDDAITVLEVPGSDPPRVVVPEFLRFWLMSLIFVPLGTAFLFVALVYVPSLR